MQSKGDVITDLHEDLAAEQKAKAVYETLNGSIDEHCPASILRLQDNAILYLDNESSKLL